MENSAAIGSEHFLLISLLIQEKYFLLTVRESQESTLISKLLRILFPDTYETRDPESEEIKSKKFQLVQTAIREIATRVNYGLSQTKQPLSHFCWRWEVTDLSQFPNHLMQLVVERRNKRKIMQDFLSGLFDSLTEDQRQELKRKRAPEKKNTEPKLKKEKKTEEPKKEKKVNEKPKKAEKPKLNPNQQVMSNFVKIIKKDPSEDPVKEERTYFESLFPPFFVKENVSVAPINQFYHTQESMELEGDPIDFKTHSWVNRKFDNRCDKPKDSCMKMHLLQFHTNQRPAYFGTLNTRNYKIKARNPFKQDPEIDYENDSDDEWEDVEDGESISSGGEEEEEEDLEDESENVFISYFRIGSYRMDIYPMMKFQISKKQNLKRKPYKRRRFMSFSRQPIFTLKKTLKVSVSHSRNFLFVSSCSSRFFRSIARIISSDHQTGEPQD